MALFSSFLSLFQGKCGTLQFWEPWHVLFPPCLPRLSKMFCVLYILRIAFIWVCTFTLWKADILNCHDINSLNPCSTYTKNRHIYIAESALSLGESRPSLEANFRLDSRTPCRINITGSHKGTDNWGPVLSLFSQSRDKPSELSALVMWLEDH